MDQELIDSYFRMVSDSIDEEGVRIPPVFVTKMDGSLDITAVSGPPHLIISTVRRAIRDENSCEIIFGLDRFTKPGQGIEFNDAFAGACGHRAAGKFIWTPYVMGYQYEPRVVLPVDWSNVFWNESVRSELQSVGLL